MADEPDRLPPWVTGQQRPFPDANLLLLPGRNPALVDSGFAGHAGQTAELSVRLHRPAAAGRQHPLARRPRWRQRDTEGQGCGITGSVADADAVARRDPRCCQAEYLDQPVTPYTVDEQLHDSQILSLGDAEWQVICTPGHTPGHLCLWRPDERLLIAGDALSDDVGWVNTAPDGPDAAATALACRELCLMENRAEPEHLRAGSTPWQSASQTQIVGDLSPDLVLVSGPSGNAGLVRA